MKNKNFIIIAHRGESYDAPENTLVSINLAWERNADAVEIDIQLTEEKKIVVIHDQSTLRTGGKLRRIATSNYDDLINIDVGKFRGAKWKNERIPLFEDVIDTVPENKTLFVEIKSDEKIIDSVNKLFINKNVTPKQIKFIGFNYQTMCKVKKIFPKFESYWIIEGQDYKRKTSLNSVITKCRKSRLNGIDVQEKKYLNEEIIHQVHNSNIKIYTWTVDDPVRAEQLYFAGIDGITTNRASWIKNKLMK